MDTFASFATLTRRMALKQGACGLFIRYALLFSPISLVAAPGSPSRYAARSFFRGVRGRSGTGNSCPNKHSCVHCLPWTHFLYPLHSSGIWHLWLSSLWSLISFPIVELSFPSVSEIAVFVEPLRIPISIIFLSSRVRWVFAFAFAMA